MSASSSTIWISCGYQRTEIGMHGFVQGVPSHNNGLESFNALIKREETLRERMPLSQFLPLCHESVQRWSAEYQHDKKIATMLIYSLADWTESYQWEKSAKQVPVREEGASTLYFCPAADKISITSEDIRRTEERAWNTMDQLKRRSQVLWIVTMSGANWQNSTCSCRNL